MRLFVNEYNQHKPYDSAAYYRNMTKVEIIVRAISVTPNVDEYITPLKVLRYIMNMNTPTPKLKSSATAISKYDTLLKFSRKLDLNMSLKLMDASMFAGLTVDSLP